ncbi:acetyl-CoA synthetase-like protein [Gonapodya prolifera JEL478]|uniref:Acetyl-CoA synthetase-like protein n=1 Tax=Gonapodya prolifera (strain JEL478) TaxID=1344416 RepID=A0A139AND0_GONPJ|nr:acetyl-CoA synthetase-like protein [Gonapodya prolifera JEL478]|eukprot:KXS18251.1 acetyl-CoA synthetase-like protein [Gonapodya prolifera JEL478]
MESDTGTLAAHLVVAEQNDFERIRELFILSDRSVALPGELLLGATPASPSSNPPTHEDAQSPTKGLDTAYIIHTSGTTRPDGLGLSVHVTHSSFMANLEGLLEIYSPNTPGFTLAQLSPPTFDPSLIEMFLPLTAGGAVSITPNHVFIHDPIPLLTEHHVTHLSCTPSFLRCLQRSHVRAILEGGTPVTHLMLGGEPFPLRALSDITGQIKVSCWNLYGTTECSVWACASKVKFRSNSDGDGIGEHVDAATEHVSDRKKRRADSHEPPPKRQRRDTGTTIPEEYAPLGQPLAHTWLHLVDVASNKPIWSNYPPYPSLATHSDEEVLAEVHLGGPRRTTLVKPTDEPSKDPPTMRPTGDIVRVVWSQDKDRGSPEPEMYYVERRDDQVKRFGMRLDLASVATALRAGLMRKGECE